ncbi:MAG TPA: ABATE domain-containing protein [Anaerolineales bacterium]|nr:ABATE domain-containing protein [Anaerolineales bacterium]
MQNVDLGLNLELKSGHPALEFTNTVNNHASEQPGETLYQYEDLLSWAKRVGLLREEQVQKLSRKASAQPDEAAAALTRSLELREAIYRIFVAQTTGKAPADRDLAILNSALARLTSGAQIARRSGRFEWQWNLDENSLDLPLGLIALSAVDLMTSEYYQWLGQCADEDGCGWLFVDTSKNHSRRWCDINDCGNRAKQRRYQKRLSNL